MEAQLITPPLDAPVPVRASRCAKREALFEKVDRYLRAAGATDDLQRRRIVLLALETLQAEDIERQVTWVEIIATVDALLGAEYAAQLGGDTGARGRIALRQGLAGPALCARAAPQRRHQAMLPSSLAPWRPSLDALRNQPIPRTAQGLAACLCWLAVLIFP